MTMKPATELDTMMFFDDALEGERTQLLTELADAVSETRTAADQAAELNEDGEAGLLRLTEIWCAMNGVPAIVIFEGGQSELLANVVAQIYAHLLQHPSRDNEAGAGGQEKAAFQAVPYPTGCSGQYGCRQNPQGNPGDRTGQCGRGKRPQVRGGC